MWRVILYFLFLSLLSCAGSKSSPKPTPSAEPSHSTTATPVSDGQAMTTGAISPGGSGGGASGRPASAEPSRYIDADDPRPAGSTPETAPTENPSEWRKKHREPPPFENFSHLEGYNKTKNLYPPGQNLASIERGRKIYDTSCYQCHGKTGAPQTNNPTLLRFNMADLRKPRQYKFGSSARGIYRSTAFGVGGPPMGFYKDALTENQIWDVTNYVLSLQESNF